MILSSQSEFFHTLFTTKLNAKGQNEFKLYGVDGAVLKQLIDCCYTGIISVDEENIKPLLQAAHEYLLTKIFDKCLDYLKEMLNSSNCLAIWDFAILYSLEELSSVARRYFSEHFLNISRGTEFKMVELEKLIIYLKEDKLNVNSEEEVFDATMRWFDHNWKKRKCHFPIALIYIRIIQLSKEVS